MCVWSGYLWKFGSCVCGVSEKKVNLAQADQNVMKKRFLLRVRSKIIFLRLSAVGEKRKN